MPEIVRAQPSRRDDRRPPVILDLEVRARRLDDPFRLNCSAQCCACNRPARYYATVACCPGWWRGTVVERRSLAGELSLSCARPAADG